MQTFRKIKKYSKKQKKMKKNKKTRILQIYQFKIQDNIKFKIFNKICKYKIKIIQKYKSQINKNM